MVISPDELLEWFRQWRRYVTIGDSTIKKRFKIASIQLTKYVDIWLERLKVKRAKKGTEKLSSL